VSDKTPAPPPGIHEDRPAEDYHADSAVSRSVLWRVYSKSPAHARFGERKETNALDLGHAIHTAILEPHEFERRNIRGPEDRRGNKWKDAVAEAEASGKLLLTAGDYDQVKRVRDAVHDYGFINRIICGNDALVEHSAYWRDEATGLLCKCRPDLVRPNLGVMVDVKSCASANAREFAASVARYGYHFQDAWYRDGWESAGGTACIGFVFIAIEKEPPFEVAVFELEAAATEEGRLIGRKALDTYARCQAADEWPGYPREVQIINLPRWGYQEITEAQEAAE